MILLRRRKAESKYSSNRLRCFLTLWVLCTKAARHNLNQVRNWKLCAEGKIQRGFYRSGRFD